VVRGSHPTEVSHRQNFQLTLAVCCECQTGADIAFGQVWKVVKDLGVSHSGSQIFEYIVDRDSQPANAWLSVALAGCSMVMIFEYFILQPLENLRPLRKGW
jgi:hypothetical protein